MAYEINLILTVIAIIIGTIALRYLSKRFNYADKTYKTAFITLVIMFILSNVFGFGLSFLGLIGVGIAVVLIVITQLLTVKYLYHLGWKDAIKTYIILIVILAIIFGIAGGIYGGVSYTFSVL